MKKLSICLSAVFLCLSLAAQSDAAYVKDLLTNNRVSFDFALSSKGKAPLQMNGKAVVDGECYRFQGNGIEVYCDGTTKWTVDQETKEVYIERSGGSSTFLDNPAVWIDNTKDLKVSKSAISGVWKDSTSESDFSFKFSSIVPSPLSGSLEGFSFDASSLGSEWVVTDLR